MEKIYNRKKKEKESPFINYGNSDHTPPSMSKQKRSVDAMSEAVLKGKIYSPSLVNIFVKLAYQIYTVVEQVAHSIDIFDTRCLMRKSGFKPIRFLIYILNQRSSNFEEH
ncbi:hypothetical protein GQX74_014287 [Glossina fuscipes]|nr:hypothetical protein GQX74_014287 [Glossina fuscipes]